MAEGDEATLAEFLETAPLYSWRMLYRGGAVHAIGQPAVLSLPCTECGTTTNWLSPNQALKAAAPEKRRAPRSVSAENEPHTVGRREGDVMWRYHCAQCREMCGFWVEFEWTRTAPEESDCRVRKVGQQPPQAVGSPSRLAKALPEHASGFLAKGNRCLQFGFGLGALAYFRRVVEESVGEMLRVVEAAASLDGDDDVVAAIRDASSQQQASERLRIAAECLPKRLRPDGVNPLGALYRVTSGGIHGGTEEECEEIAEDIRETIEWLFVQVAGETEQGRELAKRLNRLSAAKKA